MSNDPTYSTEPEHLADTPPSRSGRSGGPRAAVLGLTAVAVVGAVAAGGWAALSLMSSGAQPAEAIPANAIGYISLDLDPSASQKIQAVETLRKFPSIAKNLQISSQDDLRRWVFRQAQKEGQCTHLDYDRDVAPWIGDRIALAGVPTGKAGGSPTPLVALQVTDSTAAVQGIRRLAHCGEAPGGVGVAVSGDYALITDSQKHADAFAAQAARTPLAQDPTFQKWTSRVGDPGIVAMYAAPGAADALAQLQSDSPAGFAYAPGAPARRALRMESEMRQLNQRFKDAYAGFQGMAGVIRFGNGSVEAEWAGRSGSRQAGLVVSPAGHVDLGRLPGGTAAAVAVSLPKGWAKSYLDLMAEASGDERGTGAMIRQAEAETGLQLPLDVERLFGNGFALALGQDLDVKTASQDPRTIPAGIRISGDPQQIQAAADKVKKALGPDGEMLLTEQGHGTVALGLSHDYVHQLAQTGTLGSEATFRDVVPDADKAGAAAYVDLDAVERWVLQGMDASGSTAAAERDVRENLGPLRALGLSMWVGGDKTQYVRLRLTTD